MQCPTTPGYTSDALIDGVCTCQVNSKYVWDTTLKGCHCQAGYFDDANGCSSCLQATGYANTDALDDGRCTCDDAGHFDWNSVTKKCDCKIDFYLDTTVCKECPKSV